MGEQQACTSIPSLSLMCKSHLIVLLFGVAILATQANMEDTSTVPADGDFLTTFVEVDAAWEKHDGLTAANIKKAKKSLKKHDAKLKSLKALKARLLAKMKAGTKKPKLNGKQAANVKKARLLAKMKAGTTKPKLTAKQAVDVWFGRL